LKIGVFGDSFADRNFTNMWYHYLEREYGHTVKSFGIRGTSIPFSAKLVDLYAGNFDLVIWAVTDSVRITVQDQKDLINLSPGVLGNKLTVHEEAYQSYIKYLYDQKESNFVATCVIKSLMFEHGNILVLPAFPNPLELPFSLYNLSEYEAQYYFANQSLSYVWNHYRDLRSGHISNANQIRLAELLNKNLVSGVFQATLEEFVVPTDPVEMLFELKQVTKIK